MVNASGNASFYFRGGEYYVQATRLGATIDTFALGDGITSDADGKIVKAESSDRILGTVTHIGAYKAGNMYEWGATCSTLKRRCARQRRTDSLKSRMIRVTS